MTAISLSTSAAERRRRIEARDAAERKAAEHFVAHNEMLYRSNGPPGPSTIKTGDGPVLRFLAGNAISEVVCHVESILRRFCPPLPVAPGHEASTSTRGPGGCMGARGAAGAGPGAVAGVVHMTGRARPPPMLRAQAVRTLRASSIALFKNCTNVAAQV